MTDADSSAIAPADTAITFYGPDVEFVQRAMSSHGPVLAAIDSANRAIAAFAFDPSGRFAAVGECQYLLATVPVAAFIATYGLSHALNAEQVIVAIAQRDPEVIAALAPPRAISWVDQDPSVRFVTPQDVPREIFATLTGVTLSVSLPPGFAAGDPHTLCVRSELGWGDCAPLASLSGGSGPTNSLTAWVRDGETIELWVLDEDAHIASPVGRAISVDATTVSTVLNGARSLAIRPATNVNTAAELIAAVEAHAAGLMVTA